jgi:hypothetical protein
MYTYLFGVGAAIGRPRCLHPFGRARPYFLHVTVSSRALFLSTANCSYLLGGHSFLLDICSFKVVIQGSFKADHSGSFWFYSLLLEMNYNDLS